MDYVYMLVIVFLFVYIIFKEVIHHKERKNLLDRVMAKDFKEYVDSKKPISQKGSSFLKVNDDLKNSGFIK